MSCSRVLLCFFRRDPGVCWAVQELSGRHRFYLKGSIETSSSRVPVPEMVRMTLPVSNGGTATIWNFLPRSASTMVTCMKFSHTIPGVSMVLALHVVGKPLTVPELWLLQR